MIRRLVLNDAEAYTGLRREALEREPSSFGSSPEDDVMRDLDRVRQTLADPDIAVFGAFAPGLVGTVGVRRLTKLKTRHKTELYGMYVSADFRKQGLGEALVRVAVDFARSLDGVRQLHLCVTERAVAGLSLYEKLGFKTWGVEPSALSLNGVDVAERHMILVLQPGL